MNSCKIIVFLLLSFLIFDIQAGNINPVPKNANALLAKKAREMIGKKDPVSVKLNKLASWDAVKYCAKQAKVISQSESNKLNSRNIIHHKDKKVASSTNIPPGDIIGFFDKNTLVHCMISTGSGKAVGTGNKMNIGQGKDNVWEEISLQNLKIRQGYATFTFKSKTITVVHKPATEILNEDFYDVKETEVIHRNNKGNRQPGSTQGTVAEEVEKKDSPIKVERTEINKDLAKYDWSKFSATTPITEYERHKKDFPEFGGWQAYAAKAVEKAKKSYPVKYVITYWNRYCWDDKDGIVIVRDGEGKAVTMAKAGNLEKFKRFAQNEIPWNSTYREQDALKNTNTAFELFGRRMGFKDWKQYANEAASRASEINNSDVDKDWPKAKTKRNNGHLIYLDPDSGVFMAMDQKNKIIVMLKPDNPAEHYDYFTKVRTDKPELLNYGLKAYSEVQGQKITANDYESISDPLDGPINKKPDNEGYGKVNPEGEYGHINVRRTEDDYDDAPSRKNNQQNRVRQTNNQEDNQTEYGELQDDNELSDDGTDYGELHDDETVSRLNPQDFYKNYSLEGRYKTTDWAGKDKLPGPRVLSLEFRDHKIEFERGITVPKYLAVAYNLIVNKPTSAERFQLDNGQIVIYHEPSNLLGIYSPEGKPIQLYRPPTRKKAYMEIINQ
jgi:hypothetical protein